MSNGSPSQPRKHTPSLSVVALAGLAAIGLGGWVHGQFTHRWGGGADIAAAAAVLDKLPAEFGDWRLLSEEPMRDEVLQTLQCANHLHRRYLNVETGEQIGMAIIVGPPGPTAVHTPEICYSSRNYEMEHAPEEKMIEAGGVANSFWRLDFRSRRAGEAPLIVYYAWTEGGAWNASDSPRFEYGGSPYLFKLQLSGEPLLHTDNSHENLCHRFLRDLLDSGWTTSVGG